MLQVLNKIFVRSFYKANAGFFLFFFFLFFGAVEGNSLPAYHLSLMKSMLQSATILSLVFVCWSLYHLKCSSFFLKIINSQEATFLAVLQALSKQKQWLLYTALYAAVFAPVLLYGLLVAAVGLRTAHYGSAVSVLAFLFGTTTAFSSLIWYRLNNWQQRFYLPTLRLPFEKNLLLLLFFYFSNNRKRFLLALKFFSLSLLYLALVWNRGKYDNDSFMMFYLVLLLAHAALPYFAVQFFEKDFIAYRNLPLSLLRRGSAFLLPYALLLLPEAGYIFYFADAFPLQHRLAYTVNILANLSLLTAVQYSEAQSAEEYSKASFGVILLSVFFLHVQALWLWVAIQFGIAIILFTNGYYAYEPREGAE